MTVGIIPHAKHVIVMTDGKGNAYKDDGVAAATGVTAVCMRVFTLLVKIWHLFSL